MLFLTYSSKSLNKVFSLQFLEYIIKVGAENSSERAPVCALISVAAALALVP